MMQAQTQYRHAADEETILAFKRHILSATEAFADAPEEDLFRVNLLAQMLDRYDEISGKGLSPFTCRRNVLDEYRDIRSRMRAQGFEEAAGPAGAARWPQLSEAEAEQYIKERDAYLHRIALGVMMCTACLVPMMLMMGLSEGMMGAAEDMFSLLGLAGMFGMIGTGVYTITTAKKPDHEKTIRKGRFSLSARLRRKLEAMKEAAGEKARRRMGKGIALLAACIMPVLPGAMLDSLWYAEAATIIGVGGMFMMIGAGVYELIMADGEKKTIGRLLKTEKE